MAEELLTKRQVPGIEPGPSLPKAAGARPISSRPAEEAGIAYEPLYLCGQIRLSSVQSSALRTSKIFLCDAETQGHLLPAFSPRHVSFRRQLRRNYGRFPVCSRRCPSVTGPARRGGARAKSEQPVAAAAAESPIATLVRDRRSHFGQWPGAGSHGSRHCWPYQASASPGAPAGFLAYGVRPSMAAHT